MLELLPQKLHFLLPRTTGAVSFRRALGDVARAQKAIDGECICLGRHREYEGQQNKPRNDVLMKGVERLLQEVTECYGYEYGAERHER